MNMINKVMNYLIERKERINKFLPIFLMSYMLLLILPYVFGRVEAIDSFLSSGVSQWIFRFLSMMYAGLYLLIIGLANKIRIKYPYIIGGAILLVLFAISSIIGPHVFYDLNGNYIATAEWWWRLFGFVRFGAAIVLFIMLISFVPNVMKSHKDYNYAFYLIIGISLFAVFFSFIAEIDSLKALFNGADEHSVDIHSIFQSKNTFGLFLFLSSLATAYLIFTNIDNLRYYFFYIPLFIFTFMTIIVGCRTAFVACLLLIAYLFIRSLVMLYRISKRSFYISLGVIGTVLLAFILFMSVPSLHDGSFRGLYIVISITFSRFGDSFQGRLSLWSSVSEFMNWHYLLFGANSTNSQFMMEIYTGFADPHSGYVTWFIRTGIIGTIIYLLLLIYVFYLIIEAIKKKPLQGILVLIFLLSAMFYSVPESDIIFISTSLYTFVVNLVTIVYVQYTLKE